MTFDDDMSAVFNALGSPVRRRMLDIITASPGCGVAHVADHFEMSPVAVLKQVRVLEEANLVHTEKDGRVRRCWVNTAPIQMIHDRWTTAFSAMWAAHATRIKYSIEGFQEERDAAGRSRVRSRRVQGDDQRDDRRRLA